MPEPTSPRVWRPRRLLVTRAARGFAHGRAMVERAAALGTEIVELSGDRLTLDLPSDPARAYAEAKATLAVVVAPPSRRRFQPIPPSADWRVDLAQGCPAHCSYCYLAGSLTGPPITRAYANLDEIVDTIPAYVGQGQITSRSRARAHEGTTFEASCYTDPLAIEPVTGSLAALISWFGAAGLDAALRFTTKFADVAPLLGLAHAGRTRMRVSLNPALFARYEGGTARVADRLIAMRRMADAGYPIGLTIAPIIAAEGWQAAYGGLIADVATALDGAADVDLTVELITHRFTEGSKATLDSWYPGSALDMSAANRIEKRTKFGTSKQVYDLPTMKALRTFFYDTIAAQLPDARILYWT
ncbi:SPL family radical SAM protein [Sphingomonas sp.]|jgi:spore photoproduct lyase|uniref:SPL family radical SAM protein n=1 Tax=Sphingomonas sp. TaxID=28214 RepID=UPI002EDB4E1A